jgi:enamine deaminase RidA (YjgF/YER057c/UK114 family)
MPALLKGKLQVARAVSRDLMELYICARPSDPDAAFESQVESMYENLLAELPRHGVRLRDIVTEKVFLSDLPPQIPRLKAIRQHHFGRAGRETDLLPATTYVRQPPALPGQLCELQAFALVSGDGPPLALRRLDGLPDEASGRVVEAGDLRHVFLANITGGRSGDAMDFPGQAASLFEKAESILAGEGLTFRDVVRTWIYVDGIDRHYDELNLARREFFHSRHVLPCPASTGIQGGVHPMDRGCGLDLRALAGPGRFQVRPIHASTMNEAPTYGSDFSRGMQVTTPHREVLYVSGTASIDTEGRVLHVGDPRGQADRMLLNIQQLLAEQGAGFRHLVSAVTYLKRAEDLPVMLEVCRQRGFPDGIPNTFCVADVCRPEWLCEMEAIAVMT